MDDITIEERPQIILEEGDEQDIILYEQSQFNLVNIPGLQGPPGTGGTFVALADAPSSYDGEGGKLVSVAEDESGLEFTSPPNSAVWGGITGDLEDQDDLQSALDGKQDVGDYQPHSAGLDAWSLVATSSKADLVGGLIPTAQLPALAINDIFTVASQAAMLALTAQRGDVAVRTDVSKTFILSTDDPTQVGNWVQLQTPADAVLSVNEQTGVVVLSYSDVGAQPAGSYLTGVTADAPLTGAGTSGSHLSIPAASASQNGYLSSTKFAEFDGKQDAPVRQTFGDANVVVNVGTTLLATSAAFTANRSAELPEASSYPVGSEITFADEYDGMGNHALYFVVRALTISGAGSAGANVGYFLINATGGRGVYQSFPTASATVRWTGSQWEIRNGPDTLYSSTDDVDYPWQVTTWNVESGGTSPLPTVTQGNSSLIKTQDGQQMAIDQGRSILVGSYNAVFRSNGVDWVQIEPAAALFSAEGQAYLYLDSNINIQATMRIVAPQFQGLFIGDGSNLTDLGISQITTGLTGQASKVVSVKSDESGLEFTDVSVDLSNYQTLNGTLALGGFGSITGMLGTGNIPDLSASYDVAGAAAAVVSDTAYNATSWDGVTGIAPSKNAVRDKFETLGTAAYTASTAYDATGAAAAAQAASQPVNSNLTTLTTSTLGDLPYSSATNTLSKLAGNTTTTRKFLRQTGNGTVSAAPDWDTVTSSDVGLGSVTNDAQIKASDFPSSSVDSEIALFSGTGGKSVKRATGSGLVASNNGIFTGPRTITGTSNQISVSNGDGVSGNPTISIPTSAHLDIAKITNLTTNGPLYTSGADGTLNSEAAVAVARGGTNIASYSVGDLLYASGATALSKLADVATGNVLLSGGVTTAPSYGKVTTAHTTGIAASGANSDITSLSTVNSDLIFFYGDGSDGDVTISSGTTTPTRDMYYHNLTITGGSLNLSNSNNTSFKVFVSGTLDLSNAPANAITGTPSNGSNAVTTTGGGAGGAGTGGSVGAGILGSAGANGSTTTSAQASAASGGTGAGGASGAGGPGGNGTGNAGSTGRAGNTISGVSLFLHKRLTTELIRGTTLIAGGAGAPGGTSGGGDGTNSAQGGGGGGGGGKIVFIAARIINRGASTTAGAIAVKGGNGGNAATPGSGNVGGSGGGGGAGGGYIYIYYDSLTGATGTNILDASGGTGGNGTNGVGSGTAGGGGVGGGGGSITTINRLTGVLTTSSGTTGSAASGITGGAGETFRVSL
jgi:hypothetical protein